MAFVARQWMFSAWSDPRLHNEKPTITDSQVGGVEKCSVVRSRECPVEGSDLWRVVTNCTRSNKFDHRLRNPSLQSRKPRMRDNTSTAASTDLWNGTWCWRPVVRSKAVLRVPNKYWDRNSSTQVRHYSKSLNAYYACIMGAPLLCMSDEQREGTYQISAWRTSQFILSK
jgi:hypothetical protein